MSYTTLIAASELANHLTDPNWAIVDCRFSLDQPERGRRDYEQAHIPGAVYAYLNADLSGPIAPGKTGRHPLPEVDVMAQTLGRWGIAAGVQVVAYDDAGGSMAARLWWLLRWLGHDAVAVLDGSWQSWQHASYPTRSGSESRSPRVFTPRLRPELLVSTTAVLAHLHDPSVRLIDARTAERYRGEYEPLDPVAGHIPGAICGPFAENLDAQGRFRAPAELRARFQALLGDAPPQRAICYCGSGVTATHNLLALAHAGLGDAQLYSGSWSEWITDPERPIEQDY
jgi:thiosulfate/3-mercaptopyruvate sulfurtransferase